MLMRCLVLGLMLFVVSPVWSQDLDRLRDRVNGLWTVRKSGDANKARPYVAPGNAQPVPTHTNLKDAQLQGFAFEDNGRVVVSTKVTTTESGKEESVTVKETWVWAKDNWYVAPETPKAEATAKVAVLPTKFELVDRAIDLGSHSQGDPLTALVKFKAPRVRLQVVRVSGVPGLQVRRIEWADDFSGTIHLGLDTSLLTESINHKAVVFEPVDALQGVPNPLTPDVASLTVGIRGKIRILQRPQTEAAKRDNMIELEIRNIGDARFRIDAVRNADGLHFGGTEMPLPFVEPGGSMTLPVYYPNKNGPGESELVFRFAPGLLPNNTLYFRTEPLKP